MSQNLCLVCCYTFQEKRNRFISDEAREGFHKFCTDLGFSFQSKGKDKPKTCLELPFGEAITVCGDCLSLIVFYVQRRSVQLEQEEKLEELQRAVVKALKDLSVVVEDVQTHINELQNIVRTGDESALHKFVKMDASGNEAKSFREKVLSVNRGSCGPKIGSRETHGYKDMILPVVISVQSASDPVKEELMDYAEAYDMDYDDNPQGEELDEPCHHTMDDDFEDLGTREVVTTTCAKERSSSFSKLRARKSVTSYQDSENHAESPESQSEGDDDSDFDDAASNSSEDCKPVKQSVRPRRTRRKDSNMPKRGRGRPRKVRVEPPPPEISEPSQSPEDWKNDLIGRILEQMGNNDELPCSTDKSGSNESGNPENISQTKTNNDHKENVEAEEVGQVRHIQIVDDGLQFRGIKIQILDQQKTLVCGRCGRKFKDDKTLNELESTVETLVRNHIISKHPNPKKKLHTPIEVTSYISTSRTKTCFKIACKNLYTYDRRTLNSAERKYFRCDDRKSNCGASILLLNGEYTRMKNGWTDDGYHTLHPPNPKRTEEQIILGKAKEYSLSNPNLTIQEVWNNIVKDSNGNLPVSAMRVRRILHFARYGHERMPDAEKGHMSSLFHCPTCNKPCKGGRGLARHIKAVHTTKAHSETAKVTPSEKIVTPSKPKGTPKRVKKQIKSDPSEASSSTPGAPPPTGNQAPCGIFADSTQASNFVNRCITAIMQQVGIPVPPTNPVIPVERPAAPPSVTPSVCSNPSTTPSSPAPEHHEPNSRANGTSHFPSTTHGGGGSSQHRSGPSSYIGNQSTGQWNKFSIPPHGQQQQSQGQFNLASNNSHPNQMPLWPWSAGPH